MSVTQFPWTIALGVVAGTVTLALVWHWLRTPDRERLMRDHMARDAADPMRRWAQSAFMIVTHDCDYGYLGRAEARTMLRNWWEVHGAHELRQCLKSLEQPDRPDNAWDLVRFILVARLGAGAEYLDQDESWELIGPVARRLQAAYSDWRPMAQAYLLARRQWKGVVADGSEDDPSMRRMLDTIAQLEDQTWPATPFDADLRDAE